MDAVAFESWYRKEYPTLVAALAFAAGDAGLATDAADEAFARAYERWARVGRMETPTGWTYRTALNVIRRRQRRSHLERLVVRRQADLAPPPDWSAEVWDALLRLPPRERTAVALRYVADLTTEEIAAAMGIAPGTVGSTLHSARQRLAAALVAVDSEVTPNA